MVAILYGTRKYGEVCKVPGLFYVDTSFLHIWFIPLIPTASWLMIDGKIDGIQIGYHRRSIFFVYLRMMLIAAFFGCLILALVLLGERQVNDAVLCLLFGVFSLIGMAVTFNLAYATQEQAVELARRYGLNVDVVQEHFDAVERPT